MFQHNPNLGHIRMMAAAQPFISGAISKTINLPNEVSLGDIEEAYRESWRLSLKAVALYRDGSKLSQPLNSTSDDDAADDSDIEALKVEAAAACTTCGDPSPALLGNGTVPAGGLEVGSAGGSKVVERIIEKVVHRPLRRRLPDTRHSITHKFDIAGHEGYLTCGLFDDGSPGEVFITMAKQGSTVGGLMDTIATLVSLNLQYGVPLEAIVRKFEHMRFEPAGMTTNVDIPIAKSPIDYLVRWLGMQFIAGYRELNSPHHHQSALADHALEHELAALAPETPTAAPTVSKANGNGNGNGHGHHNRLADGSADLAATSGVQATARGVAGENGNVAVRVLPSKATAASALSQQMATLMGDAPVCKCGSITVRNGSCYKCLNCGESLGCS